MSWLLVPDLILILAMGLGLGFFGGLFGIGGGLIAVPLFVFAFGMDQATAQGTALVLMVPNLVMGWLKYQQRLTLPWIPILILAGTATITTYAMAKLALLIDPNVLQILFDLFLVATGLRMWFHVEQNPQLTEHTHLKLSHLPIIGLAGGSSMGLLGMGGGLVATPMLTIWLRQSQVAAQSLSLSLVTPCAMVALGTYANAHKVNWSLGLPMALGGLVAVSAGVALAHHLPDRTLKRCFAILLGTTGLMLFAHSI